MQSYKPNLVHVMIVYIVQFKNKNMLLVDLYCVELRLGYCEDCGTITSKFSSIQAPN